MKKNSEKIAFARRLRRETTDAEKLLWSKLRNKQLEGLRFRRQQLIGPFIVDFVSLERKVILEVDGGQHNEDEARKSDEDRTAWLEKAGYHVLRFWNNEVLINTEGVLERIREVLG